MIQKKLFPHLSRHVVPESDHLVVRQYFPLCILLATICIISISVSFAVSTTVGASPQPIARLTIRIWELTKVFIFFLSLSMLVDEIVNR